MIKKLICMLKGHKWSVKEEFARDFVNNVPGYAIFICLKCSKKLRKEDEERVFRDINI